jgi:DNA repair protein RecN (Recombination protein N)
MLVLLTITDFAIIQHLETSFNTELNILSGETGAGKSIIINAVNLILGGRASGDLIRSGCGEARVEALFTLPKNPAIQELLESLDIPFEGEIIIKRTISREGRNRITINGSPATLQMLSRLGPRLISVSGQHEHQLLLKPENHIYILDDFGKLSGERKSLNRRFEEHQARKEAFRTIEMEIREGEERQELKKFQMEEIERADIQPDEDRLLEEERKRLRHAEQLLLLLGQAVDTLYENEQSIVTRLALCHKDLDRGAALDNRFLPVVETLEASRAELEEAAMTLRDLQRGISVDPARLEEVEERLQLLHELKRKYGSSLEDVLGFRDRISLGLEGLDRKRGELKQEGKRLRELGEDMTKRARTLSQKRKKAARAFEKAVTAELEYLDMGGTRFEVRFHQENEASRPGTEVSEGEPGGLGADGYDRIEFMLSPNVGEALRPLTKTASGGELSRIMLAMKTILASTISVETIIFDEVDAGIGGATAEVVGEKLNSLANYHQIICISHLPQIASKGSTHFQVEKSVVGGRTRTGIRQLGPEERVQEIARLLGGKVITHQAVAHAREMLQGS